MEVTARQRRPIRWARGFFRGWIVLAGVWALVMGAVAVAGWQSADTPYLSERTHIFDAGTKLVSSYSDYGPEHEAAKEAASRGLYRRLARLIHTGPESGLSDVA